jgi:hypothetical protein
VLAAILLLIGGWHYLSKRNEKEESREQDEEELTQADELLPQLPPLAEDDKPKFRSVARWYLWGSLVSGVAATLLLCAGFVWFKSVMETDKTERHGESFFFKPELGEWLTVAIALTVALAVLFQWYAEMMGFEEHHKQYKKMRWVFARAYALLTQQHLAGDQVRVQETFWQLGREALGEHADWLLFHRHRPLELPRLEL